MNINKQMRKLGIVAAFGVAAAMSSSTINAATVSFTEGDVVTPPNIFNLNLVATGLVYDTNGGGLSISYDSSMLSITNSIIDPIWNFATSGVVDNTMGVYTLNLGNFGGIITGDQALATLEFTVLGAGITGTTPITISEIVTSPWGYTPPSGGVVVTGPAPSGTYCLIPGAFDCIGADPATVITLQSITVSGVPVSAVPVPAAAWLFGSGLIGLVGVARRKVA